MIRIRPQLRSTRSVLINRFAPQTCSAPYLRAPRGCFSTSVAFAINEQSSLAKTPLYDLHVSHGGNMVGFGGYLMPLQYTGLSIIASHHFTRENASLFDVSHMVQHSITGPGAREFLERVTPSDLKGLPHRTGGLSVFLWPKSGGIVDDTIITRLDSESFYVVTNAGCRQKDLEYLGNELQAFQKSGGNEVKWNVLDNHGLVALQGPRSEEILSNVIVSAEITSLKDLYFTQSTYIKIKISNNATSEPLLVTRGGYTGEDGFEISIPNKEIVDVVEVLLKSATSDKLQLAGLGARDSLRLEAGMCLYGHDLDDKTTPVEAGLSWVIGKSRKLDGNFNGADVILPQLIPRSRGGLGVTRRRVGIIVEGAPAREGAKIIDLDGAEIGNVTSGCPSPSLGKNISMGYIKDGFHRSGTHVKVLVRGKKREAHVTKMPFLPTKYWKGPSST
ncbi:Aminomethyltransferase, mitochondrial [Erysiphe necator]|uniref:Aminomethyltransferase n=1 Tax=Uncinula necator TaxID=52586 RepID=A0A0B1P907_UNCNE|nr:Aminomethyltransferase, mitochondrial [Erysiphe necator]KHJ35187.1 putative glycine cleavage system t protein [Erysiphe necator]